MSSRYEWAIVDDGDCSLHRAAFDGDVERTATLLRARRATRVDINGRNRLGCTPLRLAATAGRTECLRLLLQAGADVNVADIKAQSPLFVAVKNHHMDCMRALLAAGADPDGNPASLCSPAYVAAMDGFTEGVRELMLHGADPDVSRLLIGRFNSTPVSVALAYHHLDCLRLLLVLGGADPDGGCKPPPLGHEGAEEGIDGGLGGILGSQPLAQSTSNGASSPSSTPSPPSSTSLVFSMPLGSRSCHPPTPLPPPPPPGAPPPPRAQRQTSQSLYHATVRHSVEPEYARLLYECGAWLWARDSRGRLACEWEGRGGNECAFCIQQLMAQPRSLLSSCRLAVRRCVTRARLRSLSAEALGVPTEICRYLRHDL